MEMITRCLTEEDYKIVQELDELSGLNITEALEYEYNAWGIFKQGKLIGYCTLGYADDCGEVIEDYTGWNCNSLLLSNVYVLSEYRYKGIASTMINNVFDMHQEAKHNLVFLTIVNSGLKYLYNKIGFEMLNDDYCMVKQC